MIQKTEDDLSQHQVPFTWSKDKSHFQAALLNFRQNLEATSTLSDEVENTQIDFMAALYGLHFNVKILKLNSVEQSINTSKQLFWVEQSENMTADGFDTALNKIIRHFEIDSFCRVSIDSGKAVICIHHQQQQSHDEIATEQMTQYLQEQFYSLCLPPLGKAYHLHVDTEYMKALEPQTNLGKVARDQRVKSILEKMNREKMFLN